MVGFFNVKKTLKQPFKIFANRRRVVLFDGVIYQMHNEQNVFFVCVCVCFFV